MSCVAMSCNFEEWLHLFSSFLQETSKYDKVLIAGDFNFPDLTWNSTFVPAIAGKSISAGSYEFREVCFDFFLYTKLTCTRPDIIF